jgi:hypothetical protein
VTCKLDGDHLETGVCQSCVVKCHAGHTTFQSGTYARACCDCTLSPQRCKCLVMEEDMSSLTDREDYDVLM